MNDAYDLLIAFWLLYPAIASVVIFVIGSAIGFILSQILEESYNNKLSRLIANAIKANQKVDCKMHNCKFKRL